MSTHSLQIFQVLRAPQIGHRLRQVPEDVPERNWATTGEVVAAANVKAASTVFLWAVGQARRVAGAPEPTIVELGRKGRMARWPLHAPARAAWVARLTQIGFTWEEIRDKLQHGEFDSSRNKKKRQPEEP